MFIVLLRFSGNRGKAGQLMPAHNEWVQRGFDDAVFLVVGSLQPNQGGAIVAHDTTRSELELRLAADPFVAEDVVKAEILEISAWKTDPRCAFLQS